MSNFRRMLMMLAQDLPKRESICAVDEYSASDLGVSWVKDTMYKPTSVTPTTYLYNVTYLYNCDSILPDDYIRIFAKIQDSSLNVMCIFIDGDNVVGSSAITNTYPSVDGFYVSDNLLVPNDTKQIGFNSHGNSASKSGWRLTRTRTISQDAYDYALSFGKKVVKDLKKVIDASENPALLIKRINDWKYLIHSLVDTGYTSWLKGDGSAYVKIAKTYSTTSRMEIMYSSDTTLKNRYICGWYGGSGTPMLFLCINNATPSKYQVGFGKAFSNTTKVLDDKIHSCVIDKGVVYFDNIEYYKFTEYTEGNASTFYVFAGARTTTNGTKCNITKVIVENTLCVVPYYNGTEYCMLDINSGEIHENANVVDGAKVGAFEWMLTDASGNEVYDEYKDWSKGYYWTFSTKNIGSSTAWGLQKIDVSNYRRMVALFDNSLENKAGTYFIDDNGDYIEDSRITNESVTEQEYTIPIGAKYLCISSRSTNIAYVRCYY